MAKQEIQKSFNYGSLDSSTADRLMKMANSIRHYTGVHVEAALEIGRMLDEAHQLLPHGSIGKWIDFELPFSDKTAQKMRSAYLAFAEAAAEEGGIDTLKRLGVSTMYELAKPTAAKVRERLLKLAQSGEHVSYQQAKQETAAESGDEPDEKSEPTPRRPKVKPPPPEEAPEAEEDNESGVSEGEDPDANYVRDHFGNIIVDEEVAEAFRAVPELKRMVKQIAELYNRIAELRETPAGRMMTPAITQGLREAHVHLKAAIPYAMPPQEVLDGSDKVAAVGFLTKTQYDNVPPELKYENRDG